MAKPKEATLQTICDKIGSYYPEAKLDLVKQGYDFAEKAHQGQLRSSGEPYMIHPATSRKRLPN